MADGLPAGLVAPNAPGVSHDMARMQDVSVEDLARLWRVFAVNQHLLPNDVGRRLEHFFWRVWGSTRVRRRLRGPQLASLFAWITEGDIIRTTPRSSPRSSRVFPPSLSISPPISDLPTDHAPGQPPTQQEQTAFSVSPRTIDQGISPSGRSTSTSRPTHPARPPSILKKPGSETNAPGKTTRVLTPTGSREHSTRATNDESTISSRTIGTSQPKSAKRAATQRLKARSAEESASDSSSSSQDARRDAASASEQQSANPRSLRQFVVASHSNRRRPILNRRRSSQSSAGGTGARASPASSLPVPKSGLGGLPTSQRALMSMYDTSHSAGAPQRGFLIPSMNDPPWSVRGGTHKGPSEAIQDSTLNDPLGWFVDRSFRTRLPVQSGVADDIMARRPSKTAPSAAGPASVHVSGVISRVVSHAEQRDEVLATDDSNGMSNILSSEDDRRQENARNDSKSRSKASANAAASLSSTRSSSKDVLPRSSSRSQLSSLLQRDSQKPARRR